MNDHITRYDRMPIPPVEERTEYVDAGAVRFGVEYRLLDDAIAAASASEVARGPDSTQGLSFDDRGVSIHVFGVDEQGALEYLRFDCWAARIKLRCRGWCRRFCRGLRCLGRFLCLALRLIPSVLLRADALIVGSGFEQLFHVVDAASE